VGLLPEPPGTDNKNHTLITRKLINGDTSPLGTRWEQTRASTMADNTWSHGSLPLASRAKVIFGRR
jgi:hypothetical protein